MFTAEVDDSYGAGNACRPLDHNLGFFIYKCLAGNVQTKEKETPTEIKSISMWYLWKHINWTFSSFMKSHTPFPLFRSMCMLSLHDVLSTPNFGSQRSFFIRACLL